MVYQDYKFGVEVEFKGVDLAQATQDLQAALAGTGIQVEHEGYNHNTRPHWKVTTDATVTERGYNYRTGNGIGGEIVSPILTGQAGFDEAKKVIDALAGLQGIYVDTACGVHVHLSWVGMDTQTVKNVVRRYADYETVIDGWMPRSRRGNNNRSWCASTVGQFSSTVAGFTGSRLIDFANLCLGRYYKVNIYQLRRDGYGTVEFRQHGGSTDSTKILNWVKFLMAFVETSKTANLTAAGSTNYRRQRKIAYGEIREQVAAQGWELRFANTHYKLVNEHGVMVERVEFSTMDSMYEDNSRRLNQLFVTWFTGHFGTDSADDVFAGVETEVVDYLNARAAHFAA